MFGSVLVYFVSETQLIRIICVPVGLLGLAWYLFIGHALLYRRLLFAKFFRSILRKLLGRYR
jgi:hypothetical protein